MQRCMIHKKKGQVPGGAVDAPNPQDPDELAAIPEEELEGLEVYDPQEESLNPANGYCSRFESDPILFGLMWISCNICVNWIC